MTAADITICNANITSEETILHFAFNKEEDREEARRKFEEYGKSAVTPAATP